MISKEWINRNGTLTITLIAVVLFTVFVGSFVIDPPEHLEGIVVEKIYVPSQLVVGDTPTGGMRRGQNFVKAVKEEQWIAIVRTNAGDTLTVHLQPNHYGMKNVGDRIRFREYQGSLIHIRYFAHGEEEGDTLSNKRE